MRTSRLAAVLILPLAIGVAAPALADPVPVAAATGAAMTGPRARIRELHQELLAATVVARLKLTSGQKAKIRSVLGQARSIIDQAKNAPAVKSATENIETLLGRAIAEVHKNGKVSTDTRAALAAARVRMKAAGQAVKARLRGVMRKLKGVLTKPQRRAIARAAARLVARRGGRRGPRARKLRRAAVAHFLLSDAFYAELGR